MQAHTHNNILSVHLIESKTYNSELIHHKQTSVMTWKNSNNEILATLIFMTYNHIVMKDYDIFLLDPVFVLVHRVQVQSQL